MLFVDINEEMSDQEILDIITTELTLEQLLKIFKIVENFEDKDRIENMMQQSKLLRKAKVRLLVDDFDEILLTADIETCEREEIVDLGWDVFTPIIDGSIDDYLSDFYPNDVDYNRRCNERNQKVVNFIISKMRIKGENSLTSIEKDFLNVNI